MRLRKRLTRCLRGVLSVGVLSFWIVTGLVVQAGPAQAATIGATTAVVTPNPRVDDPQGSDWTKCPLTGWGCLWAVGEKIGDWVFDRDPGYDQVIPPSGGSSSGSWGPVPSGPSNGAAPVLLDDFSIGADGRSWSITGRNTTSQQTWGEFWVWQTCGNSNGAVSTSTYGYPGPQYAGDHWFGQGYAVKVFAGACPPGTVIAVLRTSPTPIPRGAVPGNYPWYADPAWGAKVAAAAKYKVTLDCFTNEGDPNSAMDDTVDTFTVEYSGDAGGFVYPSCSARKPGSYYGGSKTETQYPGTSSWQPVIENKPDRSSYPSECYYTGCPLQVRYRGSECQVGSVVCAEWTKLRRSHPADYTCYWGPKVQPISSCNRLERAYELVSSPVSATRPNTDGNPDTKDGSTGGGSGGSGGVPGQVEIPPTSPNDPGGDDSACYPSGLAVLNPIEWVLRPLKCALQWAFVPSGDFFPDLSVDLSGAWQNSAPGKWIGAVSGITDGLSVSSSECWAPKFTLPGQFGGEIDLQEHLCSGVMLTVRNVGYAGVSAVLVVGGALTCVRLLGSSVGYQTGGGR